MLASRGINSEVPSEIISEELAELVFRVLDVAFIGFTVFWFKPVIISSEFCSEVTSELVNEELDVFEVVPVSETNILGFTNVLQISFTLEDTSWSNEVLGRFKEVVFFTPVLDMDDNSGVTSRDLTELLSLSCEADVFILVVGCSEIIVRNTSVLNESMAVGE
ncbi:unnamed protein product [Meganyctiphanes norvegica]|uniref:Uncharacterized protein n=1 Tax=Meganyctiphanes norvegica TaxID=48144 RepID=A0AAV2RSG9_MEGNR